MTERSDTSRPQPQHYQAPWQPEHLYYEWDDTAKAYVQKDTEPPGRRHQAHDLETLVRLAAHFHHGTTIHNDGTESSGCPVEIWYSHKGAIAVLDDDQRRDRVECRLEPSEQCQTLHILDAMRRMHQSMTAGTVREYLTRGLYGCDTLKPLTTLIEGHVGRSVWQISVPPFAAYEHRMHVVVVIDRVACGTTGTTPGEDHYSIYPVQGALEAMRRECAEWVCATLSHGLLQNEAMDVETYHGTP